MTVFIYGLVDPRSDSIRYIGQSVNPIARFRCHLSDSFSVARRMILAATAKKSGV